MVDKYVNDLQEDVTYTRDAVGRGEVSELYDFAMRRKALAGAIVAPLLIVFRLPSLAIGALTVIPRILGVVLKGYEILPPDAK